MDALSLSHLTYCCATITVNFHRLDHPPFPCKSRLLPRQARGKLAQERRQPIHLKLPLGHPIKLHQKGSQSTMKPLTIIGIVLIVLGIIGFATGGISFTHQKKDVDVGPVQISHKTQDTLPLSPIFSTISLVVGLGLVVAGARTK
jgi:hypothetical protein